MAAAAIIGFWHHEILLANGVQGVETFQHAKFRQNRSNGCKDIKIFFLDFSRWRPSAISHLFGAYLPAMNESAISNGNAAFPKLVWDILLLFSLNKLNGTTPQLHDLYTECKIRIVKRLCWFHWISTSHSQLELEPILALTLIGGRSGWIWTEPDRRV